MHKVGKVMFQRLMVPLDGSHLAEAALPAAAHIARKTGASVMLIHIVERDAPQIVHGERHLTTAEEACAYLDAMAQGAFPPGLSVECHVHSAATADVAQGIVQHIDELAPDLIVMCTHGWGGLRDVLFGNIAQQVIAHGTTPVLLIRPEPPLAPSGTEERTKEVVGEGPFNCRRILMPLDGSPDHEQGVPVAAGLAGAFAAELQLVFVVPTLRTLSGDQAATGRLLPGATRAVLELAQEQAEVYLSHLAGELQAGGLSVASRVCRGEPVAAIVAAAREFGADCIVIGTHGKAGMDAFWARSVTPKLSSRSRLPLLLVPVVESTERE